MCFGGSPSFPNTPAPTPPPPPTPMAQRVEEVGSKASGGYAYKRRGTAALRTDLTIGTPAQAMDKSAASPINL
jgi:hypothetical protein